MMEEVVPLPKRKERPREVSINTTATTVVTLWRKVVAPALPKTVWLDPPKAAPIPAPFPFWRSTIKIKATHIQI
jgi:hypothetical protein